MSAEPDRPEQAEDSGRPADAEPADAEPAERLTDSELLGRLTEDQAAFEQLYRRHFAMVARFLARRCATPEDVADAASATWLAVMLSGSTYDERAGSAVSWLCSIAANEAKRLHRGAARRGALAERVRGSRLLGPDDVERLSEMIDAERAASELRLVLGDAPQGEQDLLNEMVGGDLSPAEAARTLGISSGAARVRLTRLRGRVARSPLSTLRNEA